MILSIMSLAMSLISNVEFVDLNSLPPEIWFSIFSYLNQNDLITVSKVNKRWEKMAFEPRLWKKFTISDVSTPVDVNRTLKRWYLVSDLKFIDIRDWNWITLVKTKCKFLRKLEFQSCGYSVGDIRKLTKLFPLIERLKIECDDDQIYKSYLSAICDWKCVKHLEFDMIKRYDFRYHRDFLNYIVDYCISNLENFQKLDVNFGDNIAEFELTSVLIQNGDYVTRIDINCICFGANDYCLFGDFPYLKVLNIFNTRRCCDNQLICLMKLKSLEVLRIHQCDGLIESSAFLSVFQDITFCHITAVHLKNCAVQDIGLLHLSKSCPNLKLLQLAICDKLTTQGLFDAWANCSKLEDLYLTRIHKLNAKSIERIPRCLPNLVCLFFKLCRNINDGDILNLKRKHPHLSFEKRFKNSTKQKNRFEFRF